MKVSDLSMSEAYLAAFYPAMCLFHQGDHRIWFWPDRHSPADPFSPPVVRGTDGAGHRFCRISPP